MIGFNFDVFDKMIFFEDRVNIVVLFVFGCGDEYFDLVVKFEEMF